MSLVNIHVVEEALRLATALGIDEHKMREVAAASTGDSWALRNIDQMRALSQLHGEGLAHMGRFGRKDLSLAAKLAARLVEIRQNPERYRDRLQFDLVLAAAGQSGEP